MIEMWDGLFARLDPHADPGFAAVVDDTVDRAAASINRRQRERLMARHAVCSSDSPAPSQKE
jgi:hypothetical protein